MIDGLIVKPFRVEVRGFAAATYYARSRGKALADAWSEYTSTFDNCKFGAFLKIARAYSAVGHDRFGEPITVCNEPAFYVGERGQYVRFVRPNSDVILLSHPADVGTQT